LDEGEQDSSEADDDDDAFAAKCEEELGLLKPLQQEIEANESVLIGRYFSSATEEVKKGAQGVVTFPNANATDMTNRASSGQEDPRKLALGD
jgi:hypothetical protein